MSSILCIYYSRTGNTRRAMKEIAIALDAEMVAISDEQERDGWRGYLHCGMDAMRKSTHPLRPFVTEKPIEEYDLVIIGTPVWAGRCASPVRGLLKRRGLEMNKVAYVLTRSSSHRCEAVFQQMDLYTKKPHVLDVSLLPGDVSYKFWRDKFIQDVKRYLESYHDDDGKKTKKR